MDAAVSNLLRGMRTELSAAKATLIRQGFLYAVVGLLNTALGVSLIALALWLGCSDVASNAVGYAGALALSYTLNRNITFRHKGNTARSLSKFVIVVAVGYLANLIVLLIAHRILHLDIILAQALAVLTYTVICFIGSRNVAFTADS